MSIRLIIVAEEEGFEPSVFDNSDSLFKNGDKFDMETYKNQFYNADGTLDNGNSLNWRFEILDETKDAFGNAEVTIKLKKIILSIFFLMNID